MAKTARMVPLVRIGLLTPWTAAQAVTPRTLTAKVERVSAEDTIVAIGENGTKLKIRLLGIDGPEVAHGPKPGRPYGKEEQDYLARLVEGRTIRVQTYGPDRF